MQLLTYIVLFVANVVALFEDDSMYVGGGCELVNDDLYYISGEKTGTNLGIGVKNEEFIKINLKEGISQEEKKSKWQIIQKDIDFSGKYPSFLGNDQKLYLIGGYRTKVESPIRIYDIKTSTWKTSDSGSLEVEYDKKKYPYMPYFSSVSFLDNNRKNMFTYGGLTKVNNEEVVLNTGDYYDTLKDFLVPIESTDSIFLAGHSSFSKDGNIYILGGYGYTTGQFLEFNTIMKFDYSASKWSNITAKGTFPSGRVGHSTFLLNDKLYLLGGTNDVDSKKVIDENSVYILDTTTWAWESVKIDGYKPAFAGCLKSYNSHLVYLFGYNNNGLNDKMQFINIGTQKLVQDLPKLETIELRLDIILGCTISGATILILVVAYYYIRYRRKKRALRPPKYLYEIIWAYPSSYNQIINEMDFNTTLFTTNRVNIEDDLKINPNKSF
ncbi:galactose oxidase [Neoconidiobolus thromboides FSU 785]|nr:galactose oxidase [Neoconidiobolus thromboides FSU 785]